MNFNPIIILGAIALMTTTACSEETVVRSGPRDALWTSTESPVRIVRVSSALEDTPVRSSYNQNLSRKFQQINIALQVEEFRAVSFDLDNLSMQDCFITLEGDGQKISFTSVRCGSRAAVTVPDIGSNFNTKAIIDTLRSEMKKTPPAKSHSS
ncbi:MAG: hypothetical protein AAB708_03100 [Patescibacteria group bacterium]